MVLLLIDAYVPEAAFFNTVCGPMQCVYAERACGTVFVKCVDCVPLSVCVVRGILVSTVVFTHTDN